MATLLLCHERGQVVRDRNTYVFIACDLRKVVAQSVGTLHYYPGFFLSLWLAFDLVCHSPLFLLLLHLNHLDFPCSSDSAVLSLTFSSAAQLFLMHCLSRLASVSICPFQFVLGFIRAPHLHGMYIAQVVNLQKHQPRIRAEFTR